MLNGGISGSLGPALQELSDKFQIDKLDFGPALTMIGIGVLIGSSINYFIKYDSHKTLAICSIIILSCCFSMPFMSSFFAFCINVLF